MSPGWQSRMLQMLVSVENLMAFAFPVLRMERLDGVMFILSARSPKEILRFAIITSIEDYMFSQLGFTIPGYQLSTFWTIPWGSLLMGLLAMLMAQIWSRGLEMKEEQELTI